MTLGVLALQGDFGTHKKRLEKLDAAVVLVSKSEELTDLGGPVIPGGESSTMLKLLGDNGFLDQLREFASAKPTFGTCTGAILLAHPKPVRNSLPALRKWPKTVTSLVRRRFVNSWKKSCLYCGLP